MSLLTDYVAMAKEDILNFQMSNHFNLLTLPIFLRGDICVSLWISVVKGDFFKISSSFQRTSVIAEMSVKDLLAKYEKKEKPTPYHKIHCSYNPHKHIKHKNIKTNLKICVYLFLLWL